MEAPKGAVRSLENYEVGSSRCTGSSPVASAQNVNAAVLDITAIYMHGYMLELQQGESQNQQKVLLLSMPARLPENGKGKKLVKWKNEWSTW